MNTTSEAPEYRRASAAPADSDKHALKIAERHARGAHANRVRRIGMKSRDFLLTKHDRMV